MISLPVVFFLNTNGVFILVFLVVFYLWFIEKNKEEVIHVLFSTIMAGAVCLILKELYGIPRPFITNGFEPAAGFYTSSSFPSLHTSLAFALSTSVLLHQKRLGVALFAISILIGLGRVVANVHYPLDIALGAVIGILISLLYNRAHFWR